MTSTTAVRHNEFSGQLKHWRRYRKISQLDLALLAEVSQRHLSWLETGRSLPSRDMVLRLADALDIPLRERNQLLVAAGYAGVFTERQLDEPMMAPVLNVLNDMLSHHEPYPAFVLDRLWNVKMQNSAADALLEVIGDSQALWDAVGDTGEHNIARLTLHPNGLRQVLSNWHIVISQFLRRLNREARDSGDAQVLASYLELEQLSGPIADEAPFSDLLPILPLEFALGDTQLRLFSVISTFGTAQDITTDELRIETFYPMDDDSASFFSG